MSQTDNRAAPVERFDLDEVVFEVPSEALNDQLRDRMKAGFFERRERKFVKDLLRPGDRFLDLGAGIGLVSTLAARIVGPENVISVEANPALLRSIRRNIRLNAAQGTRVIHGAVVAEDFRGDTVELALGGAFWSSSIILKPKANARVQVPAKKLSRLVAAHRVNAVTMDVEGAEADILAAPVPEAVRMMVIEFHPHIYGAARHEDLLAGLKAQGFRLVDGYENEVAAYRRD